MTTPGGFSPKRNYSGITMLPASQITNHKVNKTYKPLQLARCKYNKIKVKCLASILCKQEARATQCCQPSCKLLLYSMEQPSGGTPNQVGTPTNESIQSDFESPPSLPQKTNTARVEILLHIKYRIVSLYINNLNQTLL